jgi:hypothetical protein
MEGNKILVLHATQIFSNRFWPLLECHNWVSMPTSCCKVAITCIVRYDANTNTSSMPCRVNTLESILIGWGEQSHIYKHCENKCSSWLCMDFSQKEIFGVRRRMCSKFVNFNFCSPSALSSFLHLSLIGWS